MAGRDDVLVAVHRRAAQLRRRRTARAAVPIALIAAVAIAIGVRARDAGAPHVEVAGRSATSLPATTTVTASTTTPTTVTTTTTLVCRNSHAAACGAFRWTSAPGIDQPMRLGVGVTPTRVRRGTLVAVAVMVTDADAVPRCVTAAAAGIAIPLVDAQGHGVPPCNAASCDEPARYGPWAPPARHGATLQLLGAYTPTVRGTQTIVAAASSGAGCAYEPYGSTASATATLTVR